jgi:gamma-glutamyl hercynylcysteine S-oxide synthase
MALNLFSKKKDSTGPPAAVHKPKAYAPAEKVQLPNDPLARALQCRRFGRILTGRAEWADHPDFKKTHDGAMDLMDAYFALVPEGFVSIAMSIFDEPGAPEKDYDTEPFLLARYAVTNADYQYFVDDGGYENLELWPEDIWPHLIDFKDRTGDPGPRFWEQGRHPRELADHPVIGVCHYEAEAYARWAGYRLPSEMEWQMAATWRIRSSAHVNRRYPWGDALDLNYCNIWASGRGTTLPVSACTGGAAPNGVLQLIGNVWEWTASDFEAVDRDRRPVVGDTLLKVIRGGAYDTYFPWQAVSNSRSGLGCVARPHNVGFRCALDMPKG